MRTTREEGDDGLSPADRSAFPVSELWTKLGSSPAGLSAEEVDRRLTQYGPDELVEEAVNCYDCSRR